VLIDPQGNIAFLGHPGSINDSMVKGVLDGALTTPIYEWPKELDKVAKALRKGDLAGAIKKIEGLSDDYPEIAASIQGMVIGRVNSLDKAVEDGDWLRVETLGDELAKTLKKMPEGEHVNEVLATLKKNKEAQSILKAQKKVAKLIDGGVKKSKRDNVKKALKKIRDQYPDTAAERDAREALDGLRGGK
jgi:hypothetical protein